MAHISSTEVGGLIHVNPQAIVCSQLMEGLQLVCPILDSSLAEEIWEMGGPWPHLHTLHLQCSPHAHTFVLGL